MEKTVKIRAYQEDNKDKVSSKDNPADDKNKTLELEKKDALLEEEKARSLEHIKTIVQLRESLKKEQERNTDLSKAAAELQAKLSRLADVEENQLVKKNTQLEEEKKKSAEQLKVIELLKEKVRQEIEKNSKLIESETDLQAKLNKLAAVEDNQLAKKNTQLEEEKKKSIGYFNMIELLKESLKQEQQKSSTLEKKIVEQGAKAKELADMLRKISSIAAGV